MSEEIPEWLSTLLNEETIFNIPLDPKPRPFLAQFIGKNGSMGYKTFTTYSIFLCVSPIGNIIVDCYDSSVESPIIYTNSETFSKNWRLYSND